MIRGIGAVKGREVKQMKQITVVCITVLLFNVQISYKQDVKK